MIDDTLQMPTNKLRSEVPNLKMSKTLKIGESNNICRTGKHLQKLYQNLQFRVEAEMGSEYAPFFVVSTRLNDRQFYGHGKSKRIAKRDVFLQILSEMKKHGSIQSSNFSGSQRNNIFRDVFINIRSRLLQRSSVFNEYYNTNNSLQLPTYFADIIEAKIMNKFAQLTCGRQEICEYKVLAGIVMTFNNNFEQADVVSIATGTKCINGGNICCNGSVLNDSHAEIIARRCLVKFLYNQLYWHSCHQTERDSIFLKFPNGSQYPFALKPNVKFHLYVNTAPCGDARFFSFNSNNRNNKEPSNFNSTQYGQLRTKVEGDMGTKLVGSGYYNQTWDGVLLGERLLTMSCSDKIARWNVVGIQGSLLSQFTEPIYLSSIVLGSLFNGEHLYRAACGRIQNTLNSLPPTYFLNRPLLGRTSSDKRRDINRVPSIGINWTLGDNDIEIISLPSGRQINNETSDLSKQRFFSKYITLVRHIPNNSGVYVSTNYAKAKQKSEHFQATKYALMAAFHHAGLGNWIKKPMEQNEFTINLNE
ncbi:hypothetical protein DOY81_000898 [Sarcophaga bullata]|nr:hypothetical protein DOY81_000898 [Sarcophaga bullata]